MEVAPPSLGKTDELVVGAWLNPSQVPELSIKIHTTPTWRNLRVSLKCRALLCSRDHSYEIKNVLLNVSYLIYEGL